VEPGVSNQNQGPILKGLKSDEDFFNKLFSTPPVLVYPAWLSSLSFTQGCSHLFTS
jgi:hypothetical protein